MIKLKNIVTVVLLLIVIGITLVAVGLLWPWLQKLGLGSEIAGKGAPVAAISPAEENKIQ